MGDALRIDPSRCAFLVVDIQEKLHRVMAEQPRSCVERNVPVLAEAARRFEIPVVVSEQYPQGLGATIPSVESALADANVHRFAKVDFSVCKTEEFGALWNDLRRDQWVVVGEETHVCVYQSVRGLIDRGASVHVPRDAVASRTEDNRDVGLGLIERTGGIVTSTEDNRDVGLGLIERTGGIVTSTEVVVFDLLQKAGTDDFKALSRLIR